MEDYGKVEAHQMEKTTLESDLAKLAADKAKGQKVGEKLETSLNNQKTWWDKEGKSHYQEDKDYVNAAKLHGVRTAMLYTAAVPATMAIGFLLLVLVFKLQGGYKQVHIDDKH
jgi:hypothetical protein